MIITNTPRSEVGDILASFEQDHDEEKAVKGIFEEIQAARVEGYEDGRKTDNQVPMGVSQWLAHGKKYSYHDFFEEKAEQKGYERGRKTSYRQKRINP